MFAAENVVSNLPVDGATTAVLKCPWFFSQLLVQSEDFFFEQLEPNIPRHQSLEHKSLAFKMVILNCLYHQYYEGIVVCAFKDSWSYVRLIKCYVSLSMTQRDTVEKCQIFLRYTCLWITV